MRSVMPHPPDPPAARSAAPLPPLRQLVPADGDQVAAVYRDAVISQAGGLYTSEQIRAWASHAGVSGRLRESLRRGYGLGSWAAADGISLEAFALLDPLDRLSLLYCRGRSCRQGRATALLEALQSHAFARGCRRLRTEASQLSRPLLERQGWRVEAEETAFYDGVAFLRWRMVRDLP